MGGAVSYQVWQTIGSMIAPTLVLAALLIGFLTRRRARKLLAPQPVRLRLGLERRPHWRPRLRLWFIIVPLRLLAGRRPLFARPQRPWLTGKQVMSLEIQLGLRDPDPEPAAVRAGRINDVRRDAIPFESFGGGIQAAGIINTGIISAGAVPVMTAPADPESVLERLTVYRRNTWTHLKSLADAAAEENREFTRDERHDWDLLNERVDQLDQRIRIARETEERLAAAHEQAEAEAIDRVRRMEGYL